MNASAFDMQTGQVAGFQINNGKLIQDWSPVQRLNMLLLLTKMVRAKFMIQVHLLQLLLKTEGNKPMILVLQLSVMVKFNQVMAQ